MKSDILFNPLPSVSFGDTVANIPPTPLGVSRIIWMTPKQPKSV